MSAEGEMTGDRTYKRNGGMDSKTSGDMSTWNESKWGSSLQRVSTNTTMKNDIT